MAEHMLPCCVSGADTDSLAQLALFYMVHFYSKKSPNAARNQMHCAKANITECLSGQMVVVFEYLSGVPAQFQR